MDTDRQCLSKELALRVLLEYGVRELPVDVAELCRRMGIQVKTYQPKNSNPGQAYLLNGNPVILVSEKEPVARQRFICAHEMGHVLMGHVGQWGNIADNSKVPREEREQAAMEFAAELLMLPQQNTLNT